MGNCTLCTQDSNYVEIKKTYREEKQQWIFREEMLRGELARLKHEDAWRPVHWKIPGHIKGVSRTVLGPGPLFQTIREQFFETVDTERFDVVRIELVRNDQLWERFCTRRIALDEALKDGPNERRLFHGTQEAHLQSIIHHGFLRDFNTTSYYGKGTYFARDASYSIAERYTPPNAAGERFMLATRVLVGESCKGSKDKKIPDQKPNSTALYESMVDKLKNPSIYVLSAGSDGHA